MDVRINGILFVFLVHCSGLQANYDEYSPENVKKLTRWSYVVTGLTAVSFICFNVLKYNRTECIKNYVQKHLQFFNLQRPFAGTCKCIARAPELFTWTYIHTMFKP